MIFCQILAMTRKHFFVYQFLSRATRPMSHRVGLLVGRSCHTLLVLSLFAFLAFLSCLKVEKHRYEYIMDVNAPAQLITAHAQLITAPAQPPCIRPCLFFFLPLLPTEARRKTCRIIILAVHIFKSSTLTQLYRRSPRQRRAWQRQQQ